MELLSPINKIVSFLHGFVTIGNMFVSICKQHSSEMIKLLNGMILAKYLR